VPKVEILVSKAGPAGIPVAEVLVDPSAPMAAVAATIQKNITRNADLLKRLGLKGCGACISGMDINIRHRFDEVIQVELEKAAG